jgi:uncharacterized protein
MRRLSALLVLILGLLAVPTLAQDLPQPQSGTVNDFATLLDRQDAQALERSLTELRRTTGVQGTVVTLTDRARYGGAALEPFATRLFNAWGVGDAQRNDGFMLLVLQADREARIELGAGYPPDADLLAQQIMRNTMLPAFRQGEYSRGIREGTQAVIDLIALPHAQGRPLAPPQSDWRDRLVGAGFFAGFAAILAGIARQHWRRRRCPQCGRTGIETSSAPHQQPQPDGSVLISDNALTRRCPHCGWSETRLRPLGQRSFYGPAGELLRQERNPQYRAGPSGGGGFGGGSSRGGGASGRW